jgi:hypothetical protein
MAIFDNLDEFLGPIAGLRQQAGRQGRQAPDAGPPRNSSRPRATRRGPDRRSPSIYVSIRTLAAEGSSSSTMPRSRAP